MDYRQEKTVGCGCVCHFFVSCTKVVGDSSVDSDSKADGNGVDHVLNRIDQGKGSHGLFTDLRYKETVHNVVQRVYKHGKDHRQSHGCQQRTYRFFLHKCVVHEKSSFISESYGYQVWETERAFLHNKSHTTCPF